MAIKETPTFDLSPYSQTTSQESTPQRYEAMITPQIMRMKTLFGIPLQSNLTNPPTPMSDEAIQLYINEAISEIEHTLDLYITPVVFEEKHDYNRHEFTWNYNYLKLNHSNVLNVLKVELSFTNSNVIQPGFVQFPLEHVHLQAQEGVIQLVPAFGTSLSGFLLSAFSGTQYHALRAIGISYFPGGVRVQYRVGFDHGKIPALLVSLIEVTAAYKVLSGLSPVMFPQNSVGISIDGVSQSTSTMGPLFFKQRLEDLGKLKTDLMEAAKGYYQRRFLVDWF